ncbi:hypothetical protein THMIRHAM_01280 [Thiomicrorhabdus immobilis]|uniref:SurA N-terminal domain-containing protein n=2 Tax=Thiomicrorhabdus immobilis TaxID=2791037 RepID=A0ABM7MAI2_9GAMM|nr:hypothetical protein THMIRHAM_01280 [Thiomicrorhabdus immobilis]
MQAKGLAFYRWLLKTMAFMVLFNLGLVSSGQANEQIAGQTGLTIHQPPWNAVVKTLLAEQGVFNQKLRQAVLENLRLPILTIEQLADNKKLLELLMPRLQLLDRDLSNYVRVSESVSRFEQLKRLMPGLYNIEERKLIEALLTRQGVAVPRMRNSRLVGFLDKRISLLANGLVFNMKALVREQRDYEPDLLQAMAQQGVSFSARPPDFVLDYSLIANPSAEAGEWGFDSHIALLGKYEIPLVEVNEKIREVAASQEQAQIKTVQFLAEKVVEQLKEFLINPSLKQP